VDRESGVAVHRTVGDAVSSGRTRPFKWWEWTVIVVCAIVGIAAFALFLSGTVLK
jgi:hypothetical protein